LLTVQPDGYRALISTIENVEKILAIIFGEEELDTRQAAVEAVAAIAPAGVPRVLFASQ
jgi:hypothetical protein